MFSKLSRLFLSFSIIFIFCCFFLSFSIFFRETMRERKKNVEGVREDNDKPHRLLWPVKIQHIPFWFCYAIGGRNIEEELRERLQETPGSSGRLKAVSQQCSVGCHLPCSASEVFHNSVWAVGPVLRFNQYKSLITNPFPTPLIIHYYYFYF